MAPDRKTLKRLRDADVDGHIAYARYLCEEILSEYPDHGSTLVRYASNLIALAQYDLASEALYRAEAVVPEERLPTVLAQRGHLLEYQGAFDAAEAIHLRSHVLDPDNAAHLIYAGSAAYRRGDVKRAEDHARKAIKCSEGCIDEAYFNLGGYLLSQQKHDEARQCYVKALAIDPEYEKARRRLEDVELILGERSATGAAT